MLTPRIILLLRGSVAGSPCTCFIRCISFSCTSVLGPVVFSIPRYRPRIILLLRCSVAGSPVRNPGSLSLVGNDPQKKPFICLSPACTSQQSQLSCNNLSFNCTLKSNSSAALLYKNPKNEKRSLSSYFSCTSQQSQLVGSLLCMYFRTCEYVIHDTLVSS